MPSDRVNVLLIGGGGREHALAQALSRSPLLGELWVTNPENPGLAALGKPVDVPVGIREIYRLDQFCGHKKIGLIVIGPEDPLAEGYADKLAGPGRLIFGPRAEGAKLEADKAWAKQLMRAASVPTGDARIFTDAEGARQYLETRAADDPVLQGFFEEVSRFRDPEDRRKFTEIEVLKRRDVRQAYHAPRPDLPVIKASGLAKGKGVILPATLAEAIRAVDDIMVRRVFGEAGRTVLLEERLAGPEVSVLAITDGKTILVLPPCQDHKRLGDNDAGPNTGGMGAFCPSPALDDETMSLIERDVLVPIVDALRRDDIDYRGVIYAGLMLTPGGPKVLEFNCRFGDPECQPLMARFRGDLLELMTLTAQGRLDEARVDWAPEHACCVVLASRGYPDKPALDVPITGVEEAEKLPGVVVNYAGVKRRADGTLVTAGGRVLGVTGLGATLEEARARAYGACEKIRFEGKTLRTDIGSPRVPAPKKIRV